MCILHCVCLCVYFVRTFAYRTLKDRMPRILTQVIDTINREEKQVSQEHQEVGVYSEGMGGEFDLVIDDPMEPFTVFCLNIIRHTPKPWKCVHTYTCTGNNSYSYQFKHLNDASVDHMISPMSCRLTASLISCSCMSSNMKK